MESNYISEVVFETADKSLSRKVQLPFKTRLDRLGLLLLASLTQEKEVLPLFRFGEDVYIFRKDEQETGFGYSSVSYHVLEEETFFNLLFRHPDSASFELSLPKRQDNLVLSMSMGPISLNEEGKKLALLDGNGLLVGDKTVEASFKEIFSFTKKNLPELRKAYRFEE